jgi:hypothetical protein
MEDNHQQQGRRAAPGAVAGNSHTSQFYRLLSETPSTSVVPEKPNELLKMQRRKMLHQQCVDAFGMKRFHEVYGYYNNIPPSTRDAEYVRRLVPERNLWGFLPMVEEILQLDRGAMRVR